MTKRHKYKCPKCGCGFEGTKKECKRTKCGCNMNSKKCECCK